MAVGDAELRSRAIGDVLHTIGRSKVQEAVSTTACDGGLWLMPVEMNLDLPPVSAAARCARRLSSYGQRLS